MISRALESIEVEWLARTAAPVRSRLAHAGFVPDAPDVYCPSCGQDVGPYEVVDRRCGRCRAKRFPWTRMFRLGPYEGELASIIHDVKFRAWHRGAESLGRLLAEQIRPHAPGRLVVVPVPISFTRRMARRIDHTTGLARGVARSLAPHANGPVRAIRRQDRPTQTGVSQARRSTNLRGSMRFRSSSARWLVGVDKQDIRILVVDDVCTTGATLRATCRCVRDGLRAHGHAIPEIWVGVCARAQL